MINLAITGATGRMGRLIFAEAIANKDFKVSQALVKEGSKYVGKPYAISQASSAVDLDSNDLYCNEVSPTQDSTVGNYLSSVELNPNFDVLIDFSSKESFDYYLEKCLEYSRPIVIGVTDLSTAQKQKLQTAAQNIPVLYAPNMSIGVNLCYKLIEACGKSLGADWQVAIQDVHHKAKKDAPSGTSLQMAQALLKASANKLQTEDIQFSSIRAGDVCGEHTISFFSVGERIEISHRATDRAIFARGALAAAKWILSQPPGLYDMKEVIS